MDGNQGHETKGSHSICHKQTHERLPKDRTQGSANVGENKMMVQMYMRIFMRPGSGI